MSAYLKLRNLYSTAWKVHSYQSTHISGEMVQFKKKGFLHWQCVVKNASPKKY